MLEKDIENLIAKYPEEFFPSAGMKLKGQQVSLGRYYADVIFIDKYERLVVLEIKKGILTRDAAGQIIDYYGVLKQQNESKHIELILCANSIPPERRHFLERAGIECKEISESFIRNIANKYGYIFNDENTKISQQINSVNINLSAVQGNTLIDNEEPMIKKQRYFSMNALSRPRGKRSTLFNCIREIATGLNSGQCVIKKISELIGENYVAAGLARKIEHDLLHDYSISVKIKERDFQDYKGMRGMVSARPTAYEIIKL